MLIEPTLLVPVNSRFGQASAQDGASASFDVPSRRDLARRNKLGVLCRDVEILCRELASSTRRYARRFIKLRPLVASPLYQIGEQHPRDRSVRHARAAESGGNEDALFRRVGSAR